MKLSSRILITMLILLVAGMLSSNIILKKKYDKLDKSDNYWTYRKISQQPFKYLDIKGGNITNIAYEQSLTYSVRILEEWARYHKGEINASVKNDTLFIDFNFINKNTYEKYWMRSITAVRIFSPQLLAVNGFNTNVEMFKMKQKNFTVSMSGKSSFEVESMIPALDTVNVFESDSSQVVFEMSPEFKSPAPVPIDKPIPGQITIGKSPYDLNGDKPIKSNETITLQSLVANVHGYSILDVGHAQINSLQLNMADSSAIILSGGALKKVRQ
ncbi:MAG: hypothetical protein ABIO55_04400 [Ginsengibacter sp.]